MRLQPVFFLDLQTTGAKPGEAFILEMAFLDMHGNAHSFLVELPLDVELPRRIQLVTGITEKDMAESIPFPTVMKKLKEFIPKDSVAIIHFAQFERPFLNAAFEALKEEVPFSIICTNEIAKRLYPNLPSRGIKAMAGFFGHDSGEFKRSLCHVEATKTIWTKLLPELENLGLNNFEEFKLWLEKTPKAKKTKYEYPLPKEIRLALPDEPGVYRMLNSDRKVLYVGKATSLHSRVNSYFRGQKGRDSFKLEMLAQVVDLEVTVCETPLHAALLETDEIKRINPYYNIALKTGHRSLVFFDRNFTSFSATPDEIHSIGPFSSIMVFESMLTLSLWLKSGEELPPTTMFYEEMPAELIKDGFKLFCERHGHNQSTFKSMRSLIAQGLIWFNQREPENDSEIEHEESVEVLLSVEEIVEELSAEDIADKFERHFARVGEAYYRSKKMLKMMNADLMIKKTGKSKKKSVLKIRNGQISQDGSPSLSLDDVWNHHAIETYDRLTILLTEMAKVKSVISSASLHL
jgi:DNA polymerase-3 subunit epsilon